MYILYRKTRVEITTIPQLLNYINKNIPTYVDWICVKPQVSPNLLEWIESNVEVRHACLYSQFRQKINSTSNRVFQLDFYLDRGYSIEFAKQKVKEIQGNRTRKAIANGSLNNRLLPSNIEYWTNKGFNPEQAAQKVKERQTTFSLEKCIKKHGLKKGTEIFNQRQSKWQSTLDHTKFTTAVTWDLIQSKHKSFKDALKEWIGIAISKRAKTLNIQNMLDDIIRLDFNTIEELKQYCLSHELGLKISKAILVVLDLEINQWKEEWLISNNITINNNPAVVGVYGNHYYWNNNYYDSNGELELGMFLTNSNIQFIMHKYYPDQPYKYDFYLPEMDLYIEWTGMDEKYYTNKRVELANFNIIWTSNLEDLKKTLTKN